jgi:oligosaccharide repeat unit polymerase
MQQSHNFTSQELVPFAGILIIVVWILVNNYYLGYREFWSPLTIIAVVYGYYCCLGPYEAILSGETTDRLLNMRKYYPSSLWGAFISLLAYASGFYLYGRRLDKYARLPVFSNEVLFEYGRKIFVLGFILFTISTGGRVASLINPLDAESVSRVGGSFANYLALSLNFFIPGITLLFTYYLRTKKRIVWFVIPFLVAVGIFTTLGFRYRIVLLVSSMAIVYYLVKGKRPNLIAMSMGVIGLILIMGVINLTRKYGSGLNLGRLKDGSSERYYQSGLKESLIFQTSGAVIDMVPQRHPYAGFQPIVSTLLFPIPSRLLPDKNSAEYLFNALDAIYGKKYSKGAAIMAYAEYYLAFGWIGLALGCAITGWFVRKLWNWFLANSTNYFAIPAYAIAVSFLYVVISRGYLPQVTNLFFFTVFPVYVALRAAKKKYGQVKQRNQWKLA